MSEPGSEATVASVGTHESIATAGSVGTAWSVATAGSVATALSVATAGSVLTLLSVATAGCVACVGCVGCVGCRGCVGCIACVHCEGRRFGVGRGGGRGWRSGGAPRERQRESLLVVGVPAVQRESRRRVVGLEPGL